MLKETKDTHLASGACYFLFAGFLVAVYSSACWFVSLFSFLLGLCHEPWGNRGGWPTLLTQAPPNRQGQTQFGWHGQNMFSERVLVSVEGQREGAEWVLLEQSRLFNVKRQSYKFIYLLSPDPAFQRVSCWVGRFRHNALACHNIEKN